MNDAAKSKCSIPIRSNNIPNRPEYDSWRVGDNFLDWYGKEQGQGSYHGEQADGTPAVWTTNDQSSPYHSALNT